MDELCGYDVNMTTLGEAVRFLLTDMLQKLMHTRYCLEATSEELSLLLSGRAREVLRRVGVEKAVEELAKELQNLANQVERVRRELRRAL